MTDFHSFKVEDAKDYGLAPAVILFSLQFWINHNITNQTNFHDGEYWTYNSVKAFEAQFPYLSGKQIRTALKKLEDAGVNQTGNYNKNP